jgi:hypothetical protein
MMAGLPEAPDPVGVVLVVGGAGVAVLVDGVDVAESAG